MDVTAFAEHVKSLQFGKKLPQATYVYAPDSAALPPELGLLVDRLRAQIQLSAEFNVVKFVHDGGVSFLRYPRFHENPHPELSESVRISLVTGKVSRLRFGSDGNPPILHRKEVFVPGGDPAAAAWARLTAQEEAAGLYNYPVTIGFKAVWEGLLKEKSLAYRDHDLIELDSGASVEVQPLAPLVHRHRTALFRSGLSKPIRLALDHGLIAEGTTIFDYGCGRGSDAELLRDLGYTVTAWDPAFFPDEPKANADVVNLGYVLNVIESPRERLEVLLDAWAHTAKLLMVSTLIKGQEGHSRASVHGDGVITSRRTFQKYFQQGELQGLIESALDCEAHALSLGVFAAFRDPQMAQTFLAGRRRRVVEWNTIRSEFAPKRRAKQTRIVALYEQHTELLDAFWQRSLELGRVPKPAEFARTDELRAAAGAPATVHRLLLDHHGRTAFDEAIQRRKEDLLVYLALSGFRKRIPQKHLDAQLQEDLKAFFGGYTQAQEAGRDLLMSLSAEDALWEAACSLPFGWRDPEERHFAIHGSLLDSLPPTLRVFVECGAILYGDPHEADVVKLHLRSRKVSFLVYDDFFRRPFPELKTRIKVDLARLQVAVFEYGYALPAQLLFCKERFLAADHPLRPRMEQLSKRLEKLLGIVRDSLGTNDENAPGKAVFLARLAELGLRDDLTKRPAAPTSRPGSARLSPASQPPASGGTN
jgi:DNA phosphorothioation-associated putative methyltransferase